LKFHPLLKEKIRSWRELEKSIEKLPTTKERGEVFEQFVFVYLSLNKTLYQISEIYIEKQIPLKYRKKLELEMIDCGVDGLAVLKNETYLAYQAKFRQNRERPSYAELSKFWAEARLANYHYTIANCYSLSKLCAKNKKHLSILVDEFDRLSEDFFDSFHDFVTKKRITRKFFKPYEFQTKMIGGVLEGFRKHDRGKLIAACGTGKTLVALWVTEEMKSQEVLFIAPSLALIKQTLESWADQSKEAFSYLCICSDPSVAEEVDSGDISLVDLNVPVTTSADLVSDYLSQEQGVNKRILFCTYQSLDVLAEALRDLPDYCFDIAVFDEAHRTAGTKISGLFSLGLDDQNIRAEKRLFMTATERLVRPWIVKRAEELDRIVFSMDNEEEYGPLFYRFNFGEAIKNEVISDYRILVAGVKEKEIYDLIDRNRLLVNVEEDSREYFTTAQNIFRQIMLTKAMKESPIRKVITFHSTIKNAKAFIDGLSESDLNLSQVFEKTWPGLELDSVYLDHINGSMSSGERKERLDQFEEENYGVVSNARCLTEGVDVPIVDSIYFVNPKNSLIDIVQACGRALRKPKSKPEKIAYFIVPILFPEAESEVEVINETDFEMLHNLIQSLRDQDERLAEWIDEINLQASQGKIKDFSKGTEPPIVLDIPKEFDITKFAEGLFLRIAEVNSEPTRYRYKTNVYGKTERKSHYKRVFITIGDYSFRSYRDNLVLPTMDKFRNKDDVLQMEKIKINHNNVSHTRRLGLIAKVKGGYKLTPLGRQFFESKVSFNKIFKRQTLRYFRTVTEKGQTRISFPYRVWLKVLAKVKSINLAEFAFSLYLLPDSRKESIDQAILDIKHIKEKYPNIEVLNEANKARVLSELNEHFGTSFESKDIWKKKTTVYNQYAYFRDHLSLFDDAIGIDSKGSIYLLPYCESKIVSLLVQDQYLEKEENHNTLKNRYCEAFPS